MKKDKLKTIIRRFNCILFRIIFIYTRSTYPAGLNVKREVNPLKPVPEYPNLLYALFVYTLAFSNTIYDIYVHNVFGFSQNNIKSGCAIHTFRDLYVILFLKECWRNTIRIYVWKQLESIFQIFLVSNDRQTLQYYVYR